jgi:outer membrane protein assembly factor BamB
MLKGAQAAQRGLQSKANLPRRPPGTCPLCAKFPEKLLLGCLIASTAFAGDWLTYGHDPQRTSWAFEETKLSPDNVAKLTLKWKTPLKNEPFVLSALTAPVVASGISTGKGIRSVAYVAGLKGTIFALDAETGEPLWEQTLKYAVLPGQWQYQGTFLCPNGITATPVIDKASNKLYIIGGNGALYGLDLGSGAARYGPVQFVAPYSKNWSLNLVDGVIYTVLAQGCGSGLSGFYSIDVRDRHRPAIRQMLLSNTNTAGIWGRGGPVIGTNGRIYGGTADGIFDPQEGDYSNTEIAVSLHDLSLVDYFLPLNWQYLRRKDFDLGSASPVYFGWHNRNLLAGGAKEGVIYLLDPDKLGGADHQTTLYTSPRYSNDKAVCCEGLGIWGGMSTARDPEGQTWLIVPMGGPPAEDAKFPMTNGTVTHGSLMAFKVVADPGTLGPSLEPVWISGDLDMPDPPVIANGVVFALGTGSDEVQRGGTDKRIKAGHPAVLRAFDLKSGKELFNSGSAIASWVHFSGLAVSDGRIFAVDHDSNVYCFGLPASPN